MEYETDMKIREISQTIKKHWKWVVILTLMITISTAGINFFLLKPLFEAKTSLIIGQDRGQPDQRIQSDMVIAYQKIMKTYSEIVLSKRLAKNVARKMGNRVSPGKIQKGLVISQMTDSPILAIQFRWPDPAEALRVLSMLNVGLLEESSRLYPTVNIQVMDEPEVSSRPVQPKKTVNIVIGFLMGLLFSSGVIFLRESADLSFKSGIEIEKLLGIPVIGVIPKGNGGGRQ